MPCTVAGVDNGLNDDFLYILCFPGYYLSQMSVCGPARNRTWWGKDERAFLELPYHLVCNVMFVIHHSTIPVLLFRYAEKSPCSLKS